MKFISLFLPAVIAANYELNGKEDWFQRIVVYSKYCIYINLLMLLFIIVTGRGSTHFDDMVTVHYYVFYLVVSFLLALILPRVVVYCRKNINISIKRNK